MRLIDSLLADYGSYHRTPGNVYCHFIGIPLIMYGILALLQLLKLGPITAAELLIIGGGIFYLVLDLRLAAAMIVLALTVNFTAYAASNLPAAIAAFVCGWIVQAVGHAVYEKRSPAFIKNLLHLLVGPLFLMNELLRVRAVQLY
jgi:uncharacterized membrane protein YGL010W